MADGRDDPFGDDDFQDGWDQPGAAEDEPVFDDGKPRRGRGWKIALIIAGVVIVPIVLCCGGGVWFFYETAQNQTQDPEEIRARTQDIFAIEIPPDYVPREAVPINVFFMTLQLISYSGPEQAQLSIVEMQGQFAQQDQNRAQLEQSLRDSAEGQAKSIQEESSKIYEIDINGETVDFKLVTGPVPSSKEDWSELSGVVPTSRGMALVVIQAPAESFDKEEALTMVKSIKRPKED